MAIKSFNKETCAKLRLQVEQELQILLKKHGLTVIPRNGKYSDSTYTLTLDFVVEGKTAFRDVKSEKALAYHAPDLVGKKYTSLKTGEVLSVIAYESRKSKFPVISQDAEGKKFKASFAAVRHWVAAYDAANTKSSKKKVK